MRKWRYLGTKRRRKKKDRLAVLCCNEAKIVPYDNPVKFPSGQVPIMTLSISLPPQKFMDAVAGDHIEGIDHTNVGRNLAAFVKDFCRLKSNDTVLDLGCGCGRAASHFATDGFAGQYHGLDIVKPMIDWCHDNISAGCPNFHFHHADLDNTHYHGGRGDAATYKFPFADNTFDVVFAASVFTHLVPGSAQNYLNEIARVLRHGGRAMLSFFLLTDEWRAIVASGTEIYLNFAHEFSEGCRVFVPGDPERVVAYEQTYALKMIDQSALCVEQVVHGGWPKGPPYWQDWIRVVKQ